MIFGRNNKFKLKKVALNITYNKASVIINGQDFRYNEIADCYSDDEIVASIECDYDYIKGDYYTQITDDEMGYLLAYGDDTKDIYEIFLVIELNNGQIKRFFTGRFDENNYLNQMSCIEAVAEKIMTFVFEIE